MRKSSNTMAFVTFDDPGTELRDSTWLALLWGCHYERLRFRKHVTPPPVGAPFAKRRLSPPHLAPGFSYIAIFINFLRNVINLNS